MSTLEAALNLVPILLWIALWIVIGINIARWDGEKPCTPGEDCKNCPFPPCENNKDKGEQHERG